VLRTFAPSDIIPRVKLSPAYRTLLSGEARGLGPACLRAILWALSVPYRLAVAFRNGLYESGLRAQLRVPRPVVSIGNLTTGGTGKTPAVEWVVRWFLERGARPAILSRGYGARAGRNDEALLLAARLPDVPHRQNPSRFRAALHALKQDGANVLVLDDGFQHRRLARFGDVVLVDATCPFGFGHLLPRGLLREPAAALRRADLVIVTRADLVEASELADLTGRLKRLAPEVPLATAVHRPSAAAAYPDGEPLDPAHLSGRRVGLFCSIGNPTAFRRTVEGLGANVVAAAEFPDHHWYTEADVAALLRADPRGAEVFVTTEKDAVKLDGLWPRDRRLLVLRVEMELVSGRGEVDRLFSEALQGARYDEAQEEENSPAETG
jgi:tetraacyldisaccharide 4'-kinase